MGNKPKLVEVSYYDKSKSIHLKNFADTIIYRMEEKEKRTLVAIRFGGYPEAVRGMAYALCGGGDLNAEIGFERWKFDCMAKKYRSSFSFDNVYAEATLVVKDDDVKKVNKKAPDEEQAKIDLPPKNSFIFCRENDRDQLFEEIDRRTSVPLIPEFRDYLLEELQRKKILRPLVVMSDTEKIEAWELCCTADDKNIIEVVENGLRKKAISIPGADSPFSNAAVFKEITGVSSYLKTFGTTIAQQIKERFDPLFDPSVEPLSQEIVLVNQNITEKAGYSLYDAQLAAAEALNREMKRHGIALLIAECGSGKTKIGATALHACQLDGNKKTFNIVLCPSHITRKWVREIEETVPNSFAGVITSIQELDRFYATFQQGNRSAFAIISKEKARDGYMHRPFVFWNKRKKAFLCPHCFNPVLIDTKGYFVEATAEDFLSENDKNHKCHFCGKILWGPIRSDEQCEWVKIGGFGFVHRKHALFLKAKTKSPAIHNKLDEIHSNQNGHYVTAGAHRRYPLSSYIKKKMKGKIDFFIADELHQYNRNSGQGDAMAEIARSAKKVIGMTATLVNGYSSGIFYLLFRLFPHRMLIDGKDFEQPQRFSTEYGVIESSYEVENEDYASNRRSVIKSVREKEKPGVSPLVYSRFLLEHAVFLSLMDMGKDLPDYEEIPIGLNLQPEVQAEYERIQRSFIGVMKGDRKVANKVMSAYMNLLTVYPDQPYGHLPIMNPIEGNALFQAQDTMAAAELHAKDRRLLELVENKINAGERVLIYTSWIRIDTQDKLSALLTERGYKTAVLQAKVSPGKREEWLEKQLQNGIQVLICNPACVETGLDLNEFTTLVYYNIGYNLFTLRQSSRRSWRINQTAPRVEVYFFYYKHTIQNRAMELMASKLAVAGVIEGNLSDEGLAAMSNCQDMTTQLAKELTLGIKTEVEDLSEVFKKMAILNPDRERVKAAPIPPRQTILLPIALEAPVPAQPIVPSALAISATLMSYEPLRFDFVAIKKTKSTNTEPDKNQLSLFDLSA